MQKITPIVLLSFTVTLICSGVHAQSGSGNNQNISSGKSAYEHLNTTSNGLSMYAAKQLETPDYGNPLPKTTFNINLLGLLQFGPIFQAEFKVSKRSYIAPHIRIPYLGVLYHVINVIDDDDDVKVSPVALGIGVGYKTFFPTSRGGWYFGGVADYSFGSSSSEAGNWESRFTNLALMANGGYRWRFANSHKVLSLGAYVGGYHNLSNTYTGESDLATTTPLGMLELSFGWSR